MTTGADDSHFHPADTDKDLVISAGELAAYKMAYEKGDSWPEPPNPIPEEYVRNAESLAGNGGGYHYDASKSPPWVATRIKPEQRVAVLNELIARLNTFEGMNFDQWNQGALDFLNGRPEFEASGILNDDSIWASFIDGRPLIIINPLAKCMDGSPEAVSPIDLMSEVLLPGSTASVEPEAPSGLPEKRNAYVFNALGVIPSQVLSSNAPTVSDSIDALEGISSMLREGGYDIKGPGVTGSMTVDELKNVKDAGVLHISAHGYPYPVIINKKVSEIRFAVITTTEVTEDNLKLYDDDLKKENQRLIQVVMPSKEIIVQIGSQKIHLKPLYYAITENFVRDYITFGNNGFVFMDCCCSQNKGSQGFVDSFTNKQATYLGWVNPLNPFIADLRALFFYDRLLGLNNKFLKLPYFPKEDPPQRSFGYQDIIDYMSHLNSIIDGLKWDQGMGRKYKPADGILYDPPKPGAEFPVAKLKYSTPKGNMRSSKGFQMLVPGIHSIWVDEVKELLEINGLFGSDKRDKTRIIISEKEDDGENATELEGVECEIVKWDHDNEKGPDFDLIKCKIKRDDAGSAGYVRIEIDGRTSNVVPLTMWKGTVTYTEKSLGSLEVMATTDVKFRGCIQEFRVRPGQKTLHCTGPMTQQVYQDLKGRWQAKGVYKEEDRTITWSGNGDIKPHPPHDPTYSNVFTLVAVSTDISPNEHSSKLTFVFGFFLQPGFREEIRTKTSCSSSDNGLKPPDLLVNTVMNLNPSDYSFGEDTIGPVYQRKDSPPYWDNHLCELKWTKMEAKYTPTSKTKS